MQTPRRLRSGETLFTWILLLLALVALYLAYQISGFSSVSSPGSFPMASTLVMVVSLILVLWGNRKATKPNAANWFAELRQSAHEVLQARILIYTGFIAAYMLCIERLHFLLSSFLFLLGSILFLKGSKPVKAVVISASALGGIYLIFHFLFQVVLP